MSSIADRKARRQQRRKSISDGSQSTGFEAHDANKRSQAKQEATKADVARRAAEEAMQEAVTMEQSASCIQGAIIGRDARRENRRAESAAHIQATIRGHDARTNLFTRSYQGYLERAADESLPEGQRREARAAAVRMLAEADDMEESSALIGGVVAGHETRKRTARIDESATRVQAAMRGREARGMLTEVEPVDDSARRLQGLVRAKESRSSVDSLLHLACFEEERSSKASFDARKEKLRRGKASAAESIQGGLRGRATRRRAAAPADSILYPLVPGEALIRSCSWVCLEAYGLEEEGQALDAGMSPGGRVSYRHLVITIYGHINPRFYSLPPWRLQ